MNPIYEENSMEVLFIDFPEIQRINLEQRELAQHCHRQKMSEKEKQRSILFALN